MSKNNNTPRVTPGWRTTGYLVETTLGEIRNRYPSLAEHIPKKGGPKRAATILFDDNGEPVTTLEGHAQKPEDLEWMKETLQEEGFDHVGLRH